jgi:hypothetical protein
MEKFEFKIVEIAGEFAIEGQEDETFPTVADVTAAIERHCEDEGLEYTIEVMC